MGAMPLFSNLSRLNPQEPFLPHFVAGYSYEYIPYVNGLSSTKAYSSSDNKLNLGGWIATMGGMELGGYLDFNQTVLFPFNLQSIMVYGRYSVFDDLAGDVCGLNIGGIIKVVPNGRLIDPATLANDVVNLSGFAQFYKNILINADWSYLPYFGIDVGIANRGYPWLKPGLGLGLKFRAWFFDAVMNGAFGFGPNDYINLDTFKGYAYTRYSSLALDLLFGKTILDQGYIQLGYVLRFFSKNYPDRVNGFVLSIDVPIPIF